MKYLIIIALVTITLVSACKTKDKAKNTSNETPELTNVETKTVELKGIIKKQGVTTYQYGSHTMKTTDGFYALKATDIDLDAYIDQQVTIRGETIKGYPVSGGPDYILVKDIKRND
jgi:major membrane immunogen (membrane-anchored lipoprotein)